MSKTYKGGVKARIVSVRFAISGKVVSIQKHTGDIVKKGDILASLDRKILQTSLDKQLADFEKVRADFEIFSQKYPDPKEVIDKYLRTEKQATLNASVKDVELAKAVLDQTTLFSPVDGIIIDDSDLVAGIFVTPAGSEIKIVDSSSYFFEIELGQKQISDFGKQRTAEIEIEGIKRRLKGETSLPIPNGKGFFVRIPIGNSEEIILGLNGKANF